MNVAQNTASTQAATLVGSFTNSSILRFYSGAIPATPETAIGAQVLLCSVTLPSSSAFSQSNGVMTAAAISAGTIGTTGTAGFVRWVKSDGTTVIADGYVAASSGNSPFANNNAYTAGQFFTNGGNTYIVTTSGTSATTGTGPTGLTPGLKDGTMVCAYVDFLIATLSLVAAAQLSVTSFTYTVPSV